MLLTNPVLLGVILMCVLCLFRLNVLLSILVSALFSGLIAGISMIDSMNILIEGMKGNLETALSYILLGALAAAIGASNLAAILINFVSKFVSKKSFWFCLSIAFIACFSQNVVPIHIAFIPILIPPLLALMNKLKIDRRGVACALTFGLQAPYVAIPLGFGLIFHEVIQKALAQNGIDVSKSDVAAVMWIGGAAMFFGLILALFYFSKPRIYKDTKLEKIQEEEIMMNAKMQKKEWAIVAGIIVALVVQIWSGLLPLGAFLGFMTMVVLGGVEYNKIDLTMEKGLGMMAFIAFVMLVAAGFAAVIKETGGVPELVSFASSLSGGQFGGALIMLIIGLFVTLGIGTSFGTIPIIATIYVPFCQELGFGVAAIILLVGTAGALGDAGSPASDSTLGPTSGLNFDGQHNHIYDTCVPTFVFFNIPLILVGAVGALFV